MNGFLKFFIGIITGVAILIAGVVGGVFYAYKNITLKQLETWTGSKIPVGNEDFKNLKLDELFKLMSDIAEGKYTFGELDALFELNIPAKVSVGGKTLELSAINKWIEEVTANKFGDAIDAINKKATLEFLGAISDITTSNDESNELFRNILLIQYIRNDIIIKGEAKTFNKKIFTLGAEEIYYHKGNFYKLATNEVLNTTGLMLPVFELNDADEVILDSHGNASLRLNVNNQFLYTYNGDRYYYDVLKDAFFSVAIGESFSGDESIILKRKGYAFSELGKVADGIFMMYLSDFGMDLTTLPFGLDTIFADLTIGDLMDGKVLEEKLDNIKLSKIIGEDSDEPFLKALIDADLTIGDLKNSDPSDPNDPIQVAINSVLFEDLIDITTDDAVIKCLNGLTIGDIRNNPGIIRDRVMSLTLSDVFEEKDFLPGAGILYLFRHDEVDELDYLGQPNPEYTPYHRNVKLEDVPDKLTGAISDASLKELGIAGVISYTAKNSAIDDMNVAQAMDLLFNLERKTLLELYQLGILTTAPNPAVQNITLGEALSRLS